jgi:hypothetical protein
MCEQTSADDATYRTCCKDGSLLPSAARRRCFRVIETFGIPGRSGIACGDHQNVPASMRLQTMLAAIAILSQSARKTMRACIVARLRGVLNIAAPSGITGSRPPP